MTTHLFALGNRATTITAIAAVGFAAMLIASPARAHAAGTTTAPVLTQGMGMGVAPSTHVRRMQRALVQRGYELGAPGVDGRFGPLTATAVRRFQARHRLAVDGIVGAATRTALGLRRAAARRGRSSTATPQRPRADKTPSTTARSEQSRPKPATERPGTAASRPIRSASPTRTKRTTQTTPNPAPAADSRPSVPAATADDPADDWRTAIAIGAAAALLVAAISALGMSLARRRTYRPAPSGPQAAGAAQLTGRDHDEQTAGAGTPATATPLAPSQASVQPRRLSVIDGSGTPAIAFVRANGDGPPLPPRARVIGYAGVPHVHDANAEPSSHARAIEEACERWAWELVAVLHDRGNGHRPRRPPLLSALERVAAGEAEGLVVADVEAVHRSIRRGGALATWLTNADAALVAHELGPVDRTRGGRAPVALIRLDGGPSLQERGLG